LLLQPLQTGKNLLLDIGVFIVLQQTFLPNWLLALIVANWQVFK